MASLKHYLQIGGKYGLISLLLSGLLYVLFVLRPWKKRELDKQSLLKWFLSLWYLCVLALVVFGNRSPIIQASNIYPFEALHEALTSADRHAAIQLLLNILAFVPLGLLLVWHAQSIKKGKRLYLLAILFPLLIECTQYVARLGAMDIDDLLANSLGAIWGLCLGECYTNLKSRKPVLTSALAAILPVAVLVAGLLWLSALPYGFVRQDFPDHTHGKPQEVRLEALEGQLPASVTVYQLVSPPRSEAEATADRLFEALGRARKADSSDVYDDLAVYRAEGSNEYLWYYYTGQFDLYIPNGLPTEGTAADTALQVLEHAGYSFPEPSEAGENNLSWHFVPSTGMLYDGEIQVASGADSITKISMKVNALQRSSDCAALDTAGLEKALRQGRFSILDGTNAAQIRQLECRSAELTWSIDGKGYYHPLLRINCLIDGEPSQILAPVY